MNGVEVNRILDVRIRSGRSAVALKQTFVHRSVIELIEIGIANGSLVSKKSALAGDIQATAGDR